MRPGVLLAAAMLAACTNGMPNAQQSEAAAAETKSGSGRGTIMAVDAAAGTVTIDHGPMPEVGWSEMTMTFRAAPALLAGVAAGDRVAFEVTVAEGRGVITALAVE